VYLCSERLIRDVRDDRVSVKSVRRGVRRVSYVDAMREALDSGASSARRVYSVCFRYLF
jgi:hypothetical protein